MRISRYQGRYLLVDAIGRQLVLIICNCFFVWKRLLYLPNTTEYTMNYRIQTFHCK